MTTNCSDINNYVVIITIMWAFTPRLGAAVNVKVKGKTCKLSLLHLCQITTYLLTLVQVCTCTSVSKYVVIWHKCNSQKEDYDNLQVLISKYLGLK